MKMGFLTKDTNTRSRLDLDLKFGGIHKYCGRTATAAATTTAPAPATGEQRNTQGEGAQATQPARGLVWPKLRVSLRLRVLLRQSGWLDAAGVHGGLFDTLE